jgi:hypothetical protein
MRALMISSSTCGLALEVCASRVQVAQCQWVQRDDLSHLSPRIGTGAVQSRSGGRPDRESSPLPRFAPLRTVGELAPH